MTEKKRLLPSELQKLFIGSMPYTSEAKYDYTPTFLTLPEKYKDYQPVFTIKCPNEKGKEDYEKAAMETDSQDLRYDIIKKHTLGWKNYFNTETLEEIKYNDDIQLFKQMPFELSLAIFHQIGRLCGLVGRDRQVLVS